MNRSEVAETVASTIAGIVTGGAFILLFVLVSTPVAETVLKFVS